MKSYALILAACLLAAPASAFTPERAAIMVDAVRANGCTMSGEEAPDALQPLGLDAMEVQTFVDVLMTADLVSLSDDMQNLMLSEGLCAAEGEDAMALIVAAFQAQEAELTPWRPEFDPARGADLVAIIRGNDCALTDQQAGEILPAQDFGPEITRDIVTLMVETGLAGVLPDGSAVALSDELCAASADDDVATMTQALASWNEANPQTGGSE